MAGSAGTAGDGAGHGLRRLVVAVVIIMPPMIMPTMPPADDVAGFVVSTRAPREVREDSYRPARDRRETLNTYLRLNER
jgi:hypothetical protein